MTSGATTSQFLILFGLFLLRAVLGNDEDYYRDIRIQRQENCFDCFDTREAALCEKYFSKCIYLDKNSGEGPVGKKAKQDALDLIKELEDKSKLRNIQKHSGYCLNFQGRIADRDSFCEIDFGGKVKMSASYIAMMVSRAIQKEYDAKSVETLIVDLQCDLRSEQQYEKVLMDRLHSYGIYPAVSVLNTKRNETRTLEALAVAQTVGPNGYRMWSIHLAKQRGRKGKQTAVYLAMKQATATYGTAYFISDNPKVREKANGLFIVRIMIKPKPKCSYC